jgi:thioredoxin-related protein
MVSQEHCGYCERMKQEVLNPMLLSGEYDDKIVMRELLIDPGETVTDFSGQRQAADTFIHNYQVWVTPTLLFLDHRGRETAERILGINTVDYLLFYIESAIDDASSSMNP